MTGLLDLLDAGSDRRGSIFGVVTGVVTNNEDPEKLGRVRIKFPWLSETDESWWARVATPGAGSQERGAFFLPEVGAEVLVAFEHGDPGFPYVLGGLWNSSNPPPAGGSDQRVIKSGSGHTIALDDTAGKETISIVDKTGANSIVISSADNTVTIKSDADISISCPNGTLKLEAKMITLESDEDTQLTAKGDTVVKATTINLN
jgi:uncharacterized protein involved in type VI secretion and phage assembly